MSEPLRAKPGDTDPGDLRLRQGGEDGPLSEADRAARIEELLLSGLDQYFGGHYEQAINIWTRVAFLERGHGRARAYIDRARDALAEKQRECDELLHTGVAAYHAGELDKARDLLTRAVEAGGPNETALVFLQRVSRARTAPESPRAQSPGWRHSGWRRRDVRGASPAPSPGAWLLSIAAAMVLSGLIVLGALAVRSWIVELPVGARPVEATAREPLPIVRGAEMRIARARELYARGMPHEALRVLNEVDIADPLRGDADRLTADIQRGLLGIAAQEPIAGASGGRVR
jgi:tetratricopeptide (TPR) repeat protein